MVPSVAATVNVSPEIENVCSFEKATLNAVSIRFGRSSAHAFVVIPMAENFRFEPSVDHVPPNVLHPVDPVILPSASNVMPVEVAGCPAIGPITAIFPDAFVIDSSDQEPTGEDELELPEPQATVIVRSMRPRATSIAGAKRRAVVGDRVMGRP